MAFVKVGSLSDLPEGSVMEARAGDCVLAVCRVEGRFYALAGECPHRGGPLGHGAMDGHRVVCPWHLWEFDCRTGEYDRDPSLKQPAFAARAEGEDILIELP